MLKSSSLLFRKSVFRGTVMKPAQLAKTLLPADKNWCSVCHRVIEKKYWEGHIQSRNHLGARRKLNSLKELSLSMWESHRKAPIHESNVQAEASIALEFEDYKRTQLEREKHQGRLRGE